MSPFIYRSQISKTNLRCYKSEQWLQLGLGWRGSGNDQEGTTYGISGKLVMFSFLNLVAHDMDTVFILWKQLST